MLRSRSQPTLNEGSNLKPSNSNFSVLHLKNQRQVFNQTVNKALIGIDDPFDKGAIRQALSTLSQLEQRKELLERVLKMRNNKEHRQLMDKLKCIVTHVNVEMRPLLLKVKAKFAKCLNVSDDGSFYRYELSPGRKVRKSPKKVQTLIQIQPIEQHEDYPSTPIIREHIAGEYIDQNAKLKFLHVDIDKAERKKHVVRHQHHLTVYDLPKSRLRFRQESQHKPTKRLSLVTETPLSPFSQMRCDTMKNEFETIISRKISLAEPNLDLKPKIRLAWNQNERIRLTTGQSGNRFNYNQS